MTDHSAMPSMLSNEYGQVLPPADDPALVAAWDSLLKIDESITKGGTAKALLDSKENLQEFLSTHSQQRTYMIQTMKTCKGKDCKFGCSPLMMREADFNELSFVPDPIKGPDGDWSPLEEVRVTARVRVRARVGVGVGATVRIRIRIRSRIRVRVRVRPKASARVKV